MNNKHQLQTKVIEPPFFSNWADLFMPKTANLILPFVLRINWLTPNVITLSSFFLYMFGCLLIFIDIPYHLYYVAILLPVAYVGDCLDGQVARTRNLSSPIGNYLDKVLDVFKIYVLSMSLAFGAYLNTSNVIYIFLGFTSCFFFNYRYYIKLETIFSQCDIDSNYLSNCRARRQELYQEKEEEYKELATTFIGRLKLFWLKNRSIFWVDEAEFVVFTSIAVLFDKIEIVLWIFAISQVIIAFWRLFERGYQTHRTHEKLLDPMRK
jgi:phosphatidylglycerophosphate synthase